jgi:hypothetical protein
MSVLPRRSPFKAALISGGGVAKYAPLLDGLTQYVQLSEVISMPAGVDFEISVVASGIGSDGYQTIFSGPTIENFYRTLPDGGGIQAFAGNYGVSWATSGFATEGNRVYSLIRSGTNLSVKIDGSVRNTRSSSTQSVEIDRLMRGWDTASRTAGVVYSLEVSIGGVITTAIAFNQRNGAVQLPTVGTISAEIVNHTNAMWVEV